jgi:hypothetical protein
VRGAFGGVAGDGGGVDFGRTATLRDVGTGVDLGRTATLRDVGRGVDFGGTARFGGAEWAERGADCARAVTGAEAGR